MTPKTSDDFLKLISEYLQCTSYWARKKEWGLALTSLSGSMHQSEALRKWLKEKTAAEKKETDNDAEDA